MISHAYQCIFIHIPKCAGTSIEEVLGHLDGYAGRGGQDHRSIRMLERPLPAREILSSRENIIDLARRFKQRYRCGINPRNKLTLTKEQYENYFKFTFVRNPWARAYSWYENVMRDEIHRRHLNIQKGLPFDTFLELFLGRGLLRPQTYWLKDFKGTMPLDYIGRFETLAEGFGQISRVLGLPNITLPHKIPGAGKDYRWHYDSQSIDRVAKVCREEIELFGYSFSP